MEFYLDKETIYAVEECYGAVLEYKNKEWFESRLREDSVKGFTHISLKEAETITRSDPILDIDNLFHGMSCSDE